MKSKNLNRRDFLRICALTTAGLIAAQCQAGPPTTETPVPKVEATQAPATAEALPPTATPVPVATPTSAATPAEKVTIRWWSYFSTNDRGGLFPTIAKEFEEKNPNVKIEQSHGAAAYNEALTTSFATGDPPEVFCIQHYNWLILVAENSVLDLGDWYTQSGMKERIVPPAMAWCSVQGKTYGTSFDVFTTEWYYNATVLEKFGLSEPKTGADFFAVGKTLKDKVRFPVLFGGAEPWYWTGNLFNVFEAQTTGITEFNEGTAKKDYHIPSLLEAVKIIQQLFKEGVIPQECLGIASGADWATFATGDAAILPGCTCLHSPIVKTMEGVPVEKMKLDVFKEAPLFVPEPKSKWSAGYGAVWAIPSSNKQLATSLDFLTYLASPGVQRRFVEGNYFISSLPETWDAVKDPLLQLGVQHLKESTSEGLLFEDFMHPRVEEAIAAAMRKVATGEGPPEGVLDAMTDAVRAI